jgi:hypothetical protein
MNFHEEYKKGQRGGNKGLPMGEGLSHISNAINGIQQGRQFVVASGPKVGKSTFVNYGFLIHPFLYAQEHGINVEWIYYSLEMNRVSQEFDVAAHFLYLDHGINDVILPPGVLKKGKNVVSLSSNYLRGRMQDDNNNLIKVDPKIFECLKVVFEKRIIPLFGEFDANGKQIKKGAITFIKDSNNPTGINKYLLRHAEKSGKLIYADENGFKRLSGYKPNDPNKFTIIITDHMRKLIPESGFKMKQTIDKMSEYHCILRDLLNYTFVDIIHLNRSVSDVQRMKAFGDMLFPSSDDVKDSGNLAEDCDYLITLFNPNDERYNLKKHFGKKIKLENGDIIYPNMRTLHLVESRHCEFPQHFRTEMMGNVKNFTKLEI